MHLSERQGIIVWMHTLKQIRLLKKFGHVMYVSKKLRYAIIYCNKDEAENLMEKLARLQFVKSIEPSYRADVRSDFTKLTKAELDQHQKEPMLDIQATSV
ncbi:DUF2129 domain-containing protein [Bacillaceae bacterium SIJ1]|nr:DUF2129 domain-containing protein [Litoribacterium kuwaitense]